MRSLNFRIKSISHTHRRQVIEEEKKEEVKENVITSFSVLILSIVAFLIFCIFNIKLNVIENVNELDLCLNEAYKLPEVTVSLFNTRLSKINIKVKDNIDVTSPGTYKATYSCNVFGKKISRDIKVLVKDTIPPELALKGDLKQNICPKVKYDEEGYKAVDNIDGDITDKVKIKNVKEENIETITYEIADKSGNTSKATRIIDYTDNVSPTITLNGNETLKVVANTEFTDPGVTVTDNKDTDIKVITDSNLNTKLPGKYEIKYTAIDKSNNSSFKVRTVEVINNTVATKAPVTYAQNGSVIYLTFDDGPGPYTERLLNILKNNNVKATFFITGTRTNYFYLLTRMKNEGHSICIHTNSHSYATIYTSETAYFNDFNAVSDKIYNVVGLRPTIFRFPGGSSNTVSKNYNTGIMTRLASLAAQKGYTYFDWNVSGGDTVSSATSSIIASNVLYGITNKKVSVVLQHDINSKSVEAVDSIIKNAKARGYTFDRITENTPVVHHKIAN